MGETFDSISKLSQRPPDTNLTRWRGVSAQRPPHHTQTVASTPEATSRISLAGAALSADSQDRLVQHIAASQETLVGASPAISSTDVPGFSKVQCLVVLGEMSFS